MQQFNDEINVNEEDAAYFARREQRRERRLAEKRRREKKVRMFKAILGIGIMGVVIVCLCVFLGSKTQEGKDKQFTDSTQQQELEQEDNIQESEIVENNQNNVIQPIQFVESEDTKGITSETMESCYAILVDADTNTIIGKKNAYDRIVPASMTKVLTVLVATEAMSREDLDDTFTMTIDITDYAYINDCSSVGFLDGEVVTVRDLLYGTILASGGDAAVGLAVYTAGSHDAFVKLMNQKLEVLGIADTAHFTNCVGIYDEELYCTVYDMAVIMKAAMQNELCREVLNARTYTTSFTTEHPEGITISNWFMRRIEDKETGGEVMGAKTGYVAQSGNCAVSFQENENGTTYICVTADAGSNWKCIYDQVEIYSSISAE